MQLEKVNDIKKLQADLMNGETMPDLKRLYIYDQLLIEKDPQQRLVLECGWASLEHAGLVPEALRGGRGGVFLGWYDGGYMGGTDLQDLDGHVGNGSSGSIASGSTLR